MLQFGLVVTIVMSAIAISTTPRSVHAQSSTAASARSLHVQAQRAYTGGRYEDALALWQRALELEPRAGIVFNLSQCFGRLGRLEEESEALRRYLAMLERETPERLGDAQANSARERLVAIDERLGRTGIDVLDLTADSTLFVDDHRTVLEGTRVRLAPGPHEVRVERPGFVAFHAALTIVQGQVANVRVEYTAEAEPGVREVIVERREVVYANGPAPRSRRGLAIGMFAASGGTLALGTVLGLVGLHRTRNEFEGPSADADVRRFGISADASFVLSAGFLIAGAVAFRIDRKHRDEPAVTPVVGAGSLGIEGRF